MLNHMRTMKVFAVLVALASTASNCTSELEDQYKDRYEDQYKDQYEDQHKDHCEDQYEDRYEDQYEDQYYVGLHFGTRWGKSFQSKPSVVFGYHHNKSSKFELEVLADMSDITDKAKRKVGASLLANYRYYPNPVTNPVKLYVDVGLGGYLQIVPFGSSKGPKDLAMGEPRKMRSILGNMFDVVGDFVVGPKTKEKKDTKKPPVKEKPKPTTKDKTKPPMKDKPTPTAKDELKPPVEDKVKPITEEEPKPPVKDETKPTVKEAIPPMKRETKLPIVAEKEMLTLADKILGAISYKVKLGVDCEIIPQIVGTVAIAARGQLSGFKPPMKKPDAIIEVGIRYNF